MRPVKIADSFHQIPLSQLGKRVAQELTDHGEIYFTSKEILDAFGLAYTPADTQKAIDSMLTFNKQLKGFKCQMKNFGFIEVDRSNLEFALTYTIESTRFENQPLWVQEKFKLSVPLLALVNEMATMWIEAYKKRPQVSILQIANGK